MINVFENHYNELDKTTGELSLFYVQCCMKLDLCHLRPVSRESRNPTLCYVNINVILH